MKGQDETNRDAVRDAFGNGQADQDWGRRTGHAKNLLDDSTAYKRKRGK